MNDLNVSAPLRVAAAGDLHCTTDQQHNYSWLPKVHEVADVLLLAGDLTDNGLPLEAERLASVLSRVSIPIVGVLGNHDLAAGRAVEVTKILSQAGVQVLSGGTTAQIGFLGIAGITGAAGGFGDDLVLSRADPNLRNCLEGALREADALERGLRRLKTPKKVALMHYSPILATLAGESLRIQKHLGCAFLEQPFGRASAHAVFHGHAHHGSPVGTTKGGVPVYNVAEQVVKRHTGNSFRVFNLGTAALHTLAESAPP